MTKLTRFLVTAAIISAAAVVTASRPHGSRSTNLALLFLFLAALIAAGIFALRSRTNERRSGRKNLSPALATLSSAAIVAVYVAGYHRTSTAVGGFGEESNRRKSPVDIASNVAMAASSQPQFEPTTDAPVAPKLTTRSAKSQATNHATKSSQDAASTPGLPPSDYTVSTPMAPQPSQSSHAPAPLVAPQQISAPAVDPGSQLASSIAPAAPQPKASYKDGTYYGWGSCRHGDIQASVTIQDGKIASAEITQCLTRYSCSWISDLPGQVVKRQSPEVDYVSGASQSTDAFYGAIVSALSKARN